MVTRTDVDAMQFYSLISISADYFNVLRCRLHSLYRVVLFWNWILAPNFYAYSQKFWIFRIVSPQRIIFRESNQFMGKKWFPLPKRKENASPNNSIRLLPTIPHVLSENVTNIFITKDLVSFNHLKIPRTWWHTSYS